MIRVFAYPTHGGQRVPRWEAQRIAGTPGEGDGWSEELADGRDGLTMLALAMRWAEEGQAVRVEFN